MELEERKKAYNSNIIYGTNSEFGFDYLRDNVAESRSQIVQKDFSYAIIDEVDSILIDEAESPLIISRKSTNNRWHLMKANAFVRRLKGKVVKKEEIDNEEEIQDNEKYDYIVDLNCNSVTLTTLGRKKAEKDYGFKNYEDETNSKIIFYINNALLANGLMKKDIDYIVEDGKIYVVDKYTGRIMYGKRFNNGLHQAIESKEHLDIGLENKVVATISFQNYFRRYKKIAGMTGTAKDAEKEFEDIYGLKTVVIPTNKPVIRKDYKDIVLNTEKEKFDMIVKKIKEVNKTGQPILVGTNSIEKSEKLSEMLEKEKIEHSVLNAKNHKKEAEIISQAGKMGKVTIATNMAGRGTDIKLEKNEKVLPKGLLVIGTERNTARRIDKQLQGRAGRQGEPGESVFYVSLEDEIIKLYGNEKTSKDIIEMVQKEAENRIYSRRMLMIKYDDVINFQREIVYRERKNILYKDNIKEDILKSIDALCEKTAKKYLENEELSQMEEFLIKKLKNDDMVNLKKKEFVKRFKELAHKQYENTENTIGYEKLRKLERGIMIKQIDEKWINYLNEAEDLRVGIGLHAYKNVNPIIPYKIEMSKMFDNFIEDIRNNAAMNLLFAKRKEEK